MTRAGGKRDSYLRRLSSTHLRSSEVRRYVDLPAGLQGRVLLDLGAGTSTTSMDFVRAGAMVVALDLRFRDMAELRRSSGDYFRGYRSNLDDPVLRARNPMLAEVYAGDEEDSRRFFTDVARAPKGIYVAGDLWALPFADNSFDAVFSIRCLSDFYVDADLFLAAVREAERVVKPGSTVQISPWQADYLSLGRGLPIGASAKQQEVVLALLRAEGIAHRVRTVRASDVRCLEVIKP